MWWIYRIPAVCSEGLSPLRALRHLTYPRGVQNGRQCSSHSHQPHRALHCPAYPRSPREGVKEPANNIMTCSIIKSSTLSTQSGLPDDHIHATLWSLNVSAGHATQVIACSMIKSTQFYGAPTPAVR